MSPQNSPKQPAPGSPAGKITPTQEAIMPYVNIRVAGTLTRDQKAKIADEVTDTLHRIANKPKEAVLIFIDEVSPENIAKVGKLIDGK